MVKVNEFKQWVNDQLIPHIKQLKTLAGATPRQKVVSEILSGVERVRIDTDRNLLDVLDKIDGIRQEMRQNVSPSSRGVKIEVVATDD